MRVYDGFKYRDATAEEIAEREAAQAAPDGGGGVPHADNPADQQPCRGR